MKLQWFQFPSGLVFDGQIFGTTEIANVFKTKEAFLPLQSVTVASYVTELEPKTLKNGSDGLDGRRSSYGFQCQLDL